jgi:hypothetical protein
LLFPLLAGSGRGSRRSLREPAGHCRHHFDDPAAAECTVAPGDPPVARDQRTAQLYCRARFVVESLEVLGTDEDFPLS